MFQMWQLVMFRHGPTGELQVGTIVDVNPEHSKYLVECRELHEECWVSESNLRESNKDEVVKHG